MVRVEWRTPTGAWEMRQAGLGAKSNGQRAAQRVGQWAFMANWSTSRVWKISWAMGTLLRVPTDDGPSEGARSPADPRGVQGVLARSGRADRDDARHGGCAAGADADSQFSCRSVERGGLGVAERLGAAVDAEAEADAWRPGGLTAGPMSDSEVTATTGGGGGGGWLGERARPGVPPL